MPQPVIKVEGVGKRYQIGSGLRNIYGYTALRDVIMDKVKAPFRRLSSTGNEPRATSHEIIWALKDLSFEIKQGEVVGIIGRNGAGKSTLLKILSRITEPSEGHVRITGRVGSLLEVGTGFHPELTGRENIFLNGAILGMKKLEIDARFDDIVAFAEVEKFIDTPVKFYSSGMYVRLAFSVAAHLEPEILIVDEILAVGDYEFQKKCLGRMEKVGEEGRTVLLVSHNLNNVSALCSRCILLDHGRIVLEGPPHRVIEHYVTSVRRTGSEIRWADPRNAPGNDKVRLHAVRILDTNGKVTTDLDIQKDIRLQVLYWNLCDGASPKVGFYLRDPMGDVVLSSLNIPSENAADDAWSDKPYPAGLFQTECRFPANLFNTRTYSLDLHVALDLHRQPVDINEREVLTFTVHDFNGRNTSGIDWHGVVRPRLAWSTTKLDSPVGIS